MDGKRTQGHGYMKSKASVSSYYVDEEMDTDEEEEVVAREEEKRKGVVKGGGSSGSSRVCQIERCSADLKDAKQYHRRHRVCEVHAKASSVYLAGVSQRFCQQCSRFHELSEFDEVKRSCRRRLAGHNERRRKSSGESYGEGSGSGGGRRGITGQLMIQSQERSRVEMTLPMSNSSFKRPQIR